jgi:hypothetical protein
MFRRRTEPETGSPAPFVHRDGCDVAAVGGQPSRERVEDGWVIERCACGTRHRRVDATGGDPPPLREWHAHARGVCELAPQGVVVERHQDGYWVTKCGHGVQVAWWPATEPVPATGLGPFRRRPGVAA